MHIRRVFVFAALVVVAAATVFAQPKTISRVGIVAKPFVYNGSCPATIEFTATIFATHHPVVVEYQWERSDRSISARQRVEVQSLGQAVKDTWSLGGRAETLRMWQKLHVLAPNSVSSAESHVVVNCL